MAAKVDSVLVYTTEVGGRTFSVRDYGDEMTAHDGPGLLDRVVARVPGDLCRRLSVGGRRRHAELMLGGFKVMVLTGAAFPRLHGLWER